MRGVCVCVRACVRACPCVCACACARTYTMCQERTLRMFYTCEVRTFDQERTQSRSAVAVVLALDSDSSSLKTQDLTIKLWG